MQCRRKHGSRSELLYLHVALYQHVNTIDDVDDNGDVNVDSDEYAVGYDDGDADAEDDDVNL